MQTTQNAANHNEYRSIPVTALVESASNPRKRFDETSLNELAASLKTQGVLAPLLVREAEENKYEVIAGARRLRAAKLAELPSIPVRVVKLTDAEAIEAQCVENLQREDIHPDGGSARLQVASGTWPALHRRTCCCQSRKERSVCLRSSETDRPYTYSGRSLSQRPNHYRPRPADRQTPGFPTAGSVRRCFPEYVDERRQYQVMIPVRELAVWIESNVLLQLTAAPFDKQDETLVPDAGSCTNCPKRTGFNKLLFSDARKDSCKLCGIWATASLSCWLFLDARPA